MSARAERRRRARAAARHRPLQPDADYGTMAGWCATEAELLGLCQTLHDGLIELMGDDRVGGVQWRWWSGDEADKSLAMLREGAVGEHADYYRRIAGHLREYGGFLVVALARSKPR